MRRRRLPARAGGLQLRVAGRNAMTGARIIDVRALTTGAARSALDLLYPERHQLSVGWENGVYTASLQVRLLDDWKSF